MAVLPILSNTDPFGAMRIPLHAPANAALAATMIAVRFTGNVGPYRAQKVAGFLPLDAAALVAAGLAVLA
jgi:hypothetical protein